MNKKLLISLAAITITCGITANPYACEEALEEAMEVAPVTSATYASKIRDFASPYATYLGGKANTSFSAIKSAGNKYVVAPVGTSATYLGGKASTSFSAVKSAGNKYVVTPVGASATYLGGKASTSFSAVKSAGNKYVVTPVGPYATKVKDASKATTTYVGNKVSPYATSVKTQGKALYSFSKNTAAPKVYATAKNKYVIGTAAAAVATYVAYKVYSKYAAKEQA